MKATPGHFVELHRHSLKITLSVWRALLLREALSRLAGRSAWFWLILEPMLHTIVLSVLYSVIRQKHIGGIDTIIWLVIGLQGYFLFRRTASQMAGAIDANRALFTYRQVTPTDTVLMRGVLEVVLMIVVIAVLFVGLAMLGYDIIPYDPLRFLEALSGLWLLGVAVGLIISVAAELASEFRQVINMIMMPLYFISGVLIPIANIPEPYRGWLLLNPIVHGLDGARLAFSPYYHSVQGLSIPYLHICAIVGITIGLVLHRRFADFMVTK